MSDGVPLFRRDEAGRLLPTDHTRGPWDPAHQHGGAPAAVLAAAVQGLAPDMQVARLTYEILGPVLLEPLSLEARVVRPGRRFQLAEGVLEQGGRPAMLVRAVLLRRDEPQQLPADASWRVDGPPLRPEDGVAAPAWGDDDALGFHRTGMEIRFAPGTDWGRGPARTWFRLPRAVVEGEPVPAVARVAAAADFGNGVSRVLSFRSHLFVNTDLTVHLLRDPVGEWVLLDARTAVEPHGTGLATSVLHDAGGPLGYAHQTLFVAAR